MTQAAESKRAANRSEHGTGAAVALPHAGDTELDAVSMLAVTHDRNLEAIYLDLLARLEEGTFTDRRKFIDDYLAAMVKHGRIGGKLHR